MENWSRGELIGLIAVVVAIVAAIANILVVKSSRTKRALLIVLTVALFSLIGFLYKVEALRAAEEQSKIAAQAREEDKNKQEEVRQEEAIRRAAEKLRRERAIAQAAQEIVTSEEAKRNKRATEDAALAAAKKAIVGYWNGSYWHGGDVDFKSDGTFEMIAHLFHATTRGTYEFIDNDHIEMRFSNNDLHYLVAVSYSDDSLHLRCDCYFDSDYKK